MIVCQYFLQGRCRFGQNCRFEHTYANDDRGNRIVINAQQLHDVLSRITEEVLIAEKGGQWPLSCFAPLRGKPNFPGFEDVSPEELRWKTYQAKANGTWDQCLNEIKELYGNVERMRNRITMPTKETLTLLVNVLKSKKELSPLRTNASPLTSPTPSQNIFGGAQPSGQNVFSSSAQPKSTQNIFGGLMQSPGQSVLGTATAGQNIFGASATGSANTLGSSTQPASSPNVFASSAQSPSNQNVLGNALKSQGSIFGNSSFSGNVFGNSPQSTGNVFGSSPTKGSVFGGSTTSSQSIFTTPSTQANVFGNTSFQKQNIFGGGFSQNQFPNQGTTTTQNIFSSPAVTSNANVFSGTPAQNVFSNFGQGSSQTATHGLFQSQSAPFSQNNLFQSNAQSQSQPNVFSQNESIFKGQNAFFGGVFGAPQQGAESQKTNAVDSSVFSKMDDLSEDEVSAFKNTIFTFGKIPLKPPPQEFCK